MELWMKKTVFVGYDRERLRDVASSLLAYDVLALLGALDVLTFLQAPELAHDRPPGHIRGLSYCLAPRRLGKGVEGLQDRRLFVCQLGHMFT